ncbi:hypothetical protein HK096_004272, partial [Nowakowskiella sp. JEL0078]
MCNLFGLIIFPRHSQIKFPANLFAFSFRHNHAYSSKICTHTLTSTFRLSNKHLSGLYKLSSISLTVPNIGSIRCSHSISPRHKFINNPKFPVHFVILSGVLLTASATALALVIAAYVAATSADHPDSLLEDFEPGELKDKKPKTEENELQRIFHLSDSTLESVVSTFRVFIRFMVLVVIFAPVIVALPFWYFRYIHGVSDKKTIDWDKNIVKDLESESNLDREPQLKAKWNNRLEKFFSDNRIKKSVENTSNDETAINLWWISLLVYACEIAGPTFIKLGQYASSRTDLLSPEICNVLSKLQSSVSPHPFWFTKRAIVAEYGHTIEEIFEEFDETPVGVGAIAQVYKAKLRGSWLPKGVNQSSVCVKVLHPLVSQLVTDDISIISFFANLINRFIPGAEWLSIPQEIRVFSSMMKSQTDLRLESKNLEKFQQNFPGLGNEEGGPTQRSKLMFPTPYENLSGKAVLVESFLNAIPIGKFLELGPTKADKELANIGLDCFLRMLIIDNFVHADLHPGNIFVTFSKSSPVTLIQHFKQTVHFISSQISASKSITSKAAHTSHEFVDAATLTSLQNTISPESWRMQIDNLLSLNYRPHLIFLDAGLVCSLSPRNLTNFLDLFLAIGEFNGRRVGSLMLTRSLTPHTVIDGPSFITAIDKLIHHVQTTTLALASIKFGDLLRDVFGLVRKHRVKLEGDFVNVGVSVMLLEGIGRRLDQNLDLLEQALPVLRVAALHGVGRGLDTVVEKVKEGVNVSAVNVVTAENVVRVIEKGERAPVTREMQRFAVWVYWKAFTWEKLKNWVLIPIERSVLAKDYENAM